MIKEQYWDTTKDCIHKKNNGKNDFCRSIKDALLPNKSVSISSNSFIVISDCEANDVQYEFRLSSLLFRWLPAAVSMPSKQTDEISEVAEHKVLH
jgi:hypothetical protein